MTDQTSRDPSITPVVPGDRRKPVARYVQFGDEELQERFIAEAEKTFHSLVASDGFGGVGEIQLRAAPTGERRGLFRKAVPAPSEIVPVTHALAQVAMSVSGTPNRVAAAANGCPASRRVAQILASVATDLIRDLILLPAAEQGTHPAYRQTLRLGAELDALLVTVNESRCIDPAGCVGVRSPEHWGRRLEDVEIDEVRDVLLQLAIAGKAAPV